MKTKYELKLTATGDDWQCVLNQLAEAHRLIQADHDDGMLSTTDGDKVEWATTITKVTP